MASRRNGWPGEFGTCVAISEYETDGRRDKLAAANKDPD